MPQTQQQKREAARDGMRKLRDRRKAEREAARESRLASIPDYPSLDPAGTLADWSKERLVVPPGHPNAGQPLDLPEFGIRFLRDALAARESLLCVARKNGKSAIVAVLLLGCLAGPLRRKGWRCGVVSVNKDKAAELWLQCREIAAASELDGLEFKKAPRSIASESGTVDILSADRSAGHASGFDLAIIDELGLLRERDRELVAGLRSSVSARDGRFMALSIQGDAPFTKELLARRGERGVAVHHYAADPLLPLDSPEAWQQANPGLGTIKSRSYLEHEAKRVLAVPADQASFKAFDLNQPQSPSREMVASVADWQRCIVPADELPDRTGPCVVGFDLGSAASMCSATAFWPSTGRMECWGAFPDEPPLADRAQADGVGDLYRRMHERGELALYSGRVTPAGEFLRDVAARLAGEDVVMAGADRFRKAEAQQALEDAASDWPVTWRGTGAHARADGSHDVRAFQRLVLSEKIRIAPSLLLESAIAESTVRRDAAGNPALAKAREKARIDALQAAVIAAGLGELHGGRSDWSGFKVTVC